MTAIYEKALLVIAWLGPIDNAAWASEEVAFLLDAIPLLAPTVYEMEDKSTIFNVAHSILNWEGTKDSKLIKDALLLGLPQILTKPYWTRVWLIQELTAARALFHKYGLSVVDYAGLQIILMAMEMYRSRSDQEGGSSAASQTAAGNSSGGSSVGAGYWTTVGKEQIGLVDSFRSPNPIDAPVDRSWRKRLAWQLLFYASMHQSTDSIDRLFGLLGISELVQLPIMQCQWGKSIWTTQRCMSGNRKIFNFSV